MRVGYILRLNRPCNPIHCSSRRRNRPDSGHPYSQLKFCTVTVNRGGKQLTLEITLDERPQQTDEQTPETTQPTPDSGSFDDWYEYFRRYFGG